MGYVVGTDTKEAVERSFAGAGFSTWRYQGARRSLVEVSVILHHQRKVKYKIFATQKLEKLQQSAVRGRQ